MDILKTMPSKNRLSSLSYKIVDKINKLFVLEDKAHKNKLFGNELISFRQEEEEELPLINDIHDLVFNNTPKKEVLWKMHLIIQRKYGMIYSLI